MTPNVRPLVAGNWKMNGTSTMLNELERVAAATVEPGLACDTALCLPATLLERGSRAAHGTNLAIGAQDCHSAASGAHTGDISVEMIADAGASMAIVGHSERRTDHFETSEIVASKAQAAIAANLTAIICIGETMQERQDKRHIEVVSDQLAKSVPDSADAQNAVIAYEPVWAIGTGLTASPADIEEIHKVIRDALITRFSDGAIFRILYGGSVKPANASEIFATPNVDGGLIGGASLKSTDFLAICQAA